MIFKILNSHADRFFKKRDDPLVLTLPDFIMAILSPSMSASSLTEINITNTSYLQYLKQRAIKLYNAATVAMMCNPLSLHKLSGK